MVKIMIKDIAVLCWAPMTYAIQVGVGPSNKEDHVFSVGKTIKKLGVAGLAATAALANPSAASDCGNNPFAAVDYTNDSAKQDYIAAKALQCAEHGRQLDLIQGDRCNQRIELQGDCDIIDCAEVGGSVRLFATDLTLQGDGHMVQPFVKKINADNTDAICGVTISGKNDGLKSVSFPNLESTSCVDVYQGHNDFKTFDAPRLTTLTSERGGVGVFSNAALETFNMPALTHVPGTLSVKNNGKLETVDLSSVGHVCTEGQINDGIEVYDNEFLNTFKVKDSFHLDGCTKPGNDKDDDVRRKAQNNGPALNQACKAVRPDAGCEFKNSGPGTQWVAECSNEEVITCLGVTGGDHQPVEWTDTQKDDYARDLKDKCMKKYAVSGNAQQDLYWEICEDPSSSPDCYQRCPGPNDVTGIDSACMIMKCEDVGTIDMRFQRYPADAHVVQPYIKTIQGSNGLEIAGNYGDLQSVSFPNVKSIANQIHVNSGNENLKKIDLPLLQELSTHGAGIDLIANRGLETFSAPSLTTVPGILNVDSNSQLQKVDLRNADGACTQYDPNRNDQFKVKNNGALESFLVAEEFDVEGCKISPDVQQNNEFCPAGATTTDQVVECLGGTAAPTFDGVLSLSSSADIQNAMTYEVIQGDLKIDSSFSGAFSGLPNLKTVNGDVYMTESQLQGALTFENLEEITGNLYLAGNQMSEIRLPSLKTVGGSIHIVNSANLDTVFLPLVQEVGGYLKIEDAGNLETVRFDLLQTVGVGNSEDVSEDLLAATGLEIVNVAVQEIRFPQLTSVAQGNFKISDISTLQSLSAPKLANVNENFLVQYTDVSSLSFPKLSSVGKKVVVKGNVGMETLCLPSMVNMKGSLAIEENTALTNINMPNLVDLIAPEGSGAQHFVIRDNHEIEEISFPSLTTISGAVVAFERMNSVTTLNFPSLETACCGVNFRIKEMPELQAVSFPALKTVGSQVLIQKNAAMTSISMPALERVQEGSEGNNLAGRFKIGPDNNSLTNIDLGAAVVDGNLNVMNNCALQTNQNLFAHLQVNGKRQIRNNGKGC